MKVVFDVQHLYYLPQYLPVIKLLKQQSVEVKLIGFHTNDADLNTIIEQSLLATETEFSIVDNWQQALSYYLTCTADWIVFGNSVSNLDRIHQHSKTVLMQHGVGPKTCYYEVSETPTSVRFVEGKKRLANLQAMYPNAEFVDTGYAKLDPALNQNMPSKTLSSLGLDKAKPTLLYAPTFYPSSLERFDKNFPKQFSKYNIILKPHFFSLTKAKYAKQKSLLEYWNQSDNVYLAQVEEYNLLEFMAISDVLISDASSAIFEFAALNKPVVWCDFYKLRWSYRGVFSFRFKQRIDQSIEVFHQLCERASAYKELKSCVEQAVKQPDTKQAVRQAITDEYVGKVDGHCSQRIVNYLLENKE
jgi:hypothetical protein